MMEEKTEALILGILGPTIGLEVNCLPPDEINFPSPSMESSPAEEAASTPSDLP